MNRKDCTTPGLRTVLVLIVSVITLIIIVIFTYFNTQQFRHEAMAHMSHYADTVSQDIASAVADDIITEDYASLQDAIFSFHRRPHVASVTITTPDGIVIGDTLPERLGTTLDLMGMKQEDKKSNRQHIDLSAWNVDSLLPIRVGDAVIGYCRVVLNIEYIHHAIDTIQQKSIAFGGIVLLLFWGIVIALSSIITRPLEKMMNVAAKVAEGHFDQQAEKKGVREIRMLAETFNLMTEAIRERETRLRNILDSIPDAVFHADHKKRVLWANRTVREKHRISMGEPCYRVLWGRDRECRPCCCQDALQEKRRILTTCMAPAAENEAPVYLDVAAVPLNDTPGKDGGFVVIARDISDVIEAEKERAELEVQLRHAQKMEAMGELSSSIAHEFGNPLVGVNFLLKHIRENVALSDEDRKLVGVGLEEVARMQSLIRDLKSFYQPSSGEKILTDIHRRIDNILLFHQKYFQSHKVSVRKKYDPSLPEITIVQDQITQVFVNLLVNAVEAFPAEGGTLTIITARQDDRITISFHDTGIGISREDQKKIFKPFFSTKPDVEGTGLGLSVSYGIVKSHDGDLLVSSTPGKGTTFTVVLPIGT